jgi:Thymidylate kinase
MDITFGVRVGPFEVFAPFRPTIWRLYQGNGYVPGRLFIVEGIDGSGKSTQLSLLHKWLQSRGYGVVFSESNSSPGGQQWRFIFACRSRLRLGGFSTAATASSFMIER